MPDPRCSRPDVALAMNASFLGFFAHAGFLAGLEDLELQPGKIAGASAGAIAGALHATGHDAEAMRGILFDPDFDKYFIEKRSLLRIPGMIIGRPGRDGAMRGQKIAARFRELFSDRQIEDLSDPELALAVTNLTEARSQLVTHGDLVEHTLASFAFPGVYASRRIGEHHFWDGGIALPIPFAHWADDDAVNTVIIHRVKAGDDSDAAAKRSLNASMHLAHVATARELFELRKTKLESAGKRLIILDTPTPRLGIFHKATMRRECYELGLATARENADQLAEI